MQTNKSRLGLCLVHVAPQLIHTFIRKPTFIALKSSLGYTTSQGCQKKPATGKCLEPAPSSPNASRLVLSMTLSKYFFGLATSTS